VTDDRETVYHGLASLDQAVMLEGELTKAGVEVTASTLWKHRSKLRQAMREVGRLVRTGRLTILVFGAGGAGKSTVGKYITGRLTEDELEKGYRSSVAIERFGIPSTVGGRVMVAPGQRARAEYAQQDMLALLTAGKVDGVINVVAYGHHAWDGLGGYRDHPLWQTGMRREVFVQTYLAARQQDEIAHATRLAERLRNAPRIPWLLTLVVKQDLWWAKRQAVRDHYETGSYHDAIRSAFPSTDPIVRHEIAQAALTWENLTDNNGVTLVPVASGYDRSERLEGIDRLNWVLTQWTGVEA
jgi:hypothetical protein